MGTGSPSVSIPVGGVNRRILSAAATVMAASVIVKLAGIFKEITVADIYGRSEAMDAYLAAILIPGLLINLISESMNQALMPTLIRVRETEGPTHAQELLSNAMLWTCGLLILVSTTMALCARGIFSLTASHFGPEKTNLAIHLFYQLLPVETGRLDLLDPSAWPRRGAGPRRSQLAAVRDFSAQLARADDRFASIIGTGQRTVTGIERRGGQFHYQVSAAGDGTVAVLRATLPGASNHYLRCEHSELPRSELVAAAVIDLLRTGRTRRLPQRVIIRKGRPTYVSDAELRGSLDRKIDWQSLRTAERRRYLQRLNSPPPLYWPR